MLAAWDFGSRQCDTANREQQMPGHPWNLWKSSWKQGRKEVALAPLPRSPSFCSHADSSGVWRPRLTTTAGNPCARSLAVVQTVGSLLWVSQPYLSQKDDTGEGDTAAVQVQISAGFLLLPKFLFVEGQMLVLLDWQVWFTGARGSKGGGRQGGAHLVSCGCCSPGWFGCVKGCPAAEQLGSAGDPPHAPGTPCSSPTSTGSVCKAAHAQGKSHPLCPVLVFQEL